MSVDLFSTVDRKTSERIARDVDVCFGFLARQREWMTLEELQTILGGSHPEARDIFLRYSGVFTHHAL